MRAESNVNELVHAIAARASALADMPLPVLRKVVESQTGASTRGALIEEQLWEEFEEEYPRIIREAE